MRPYAAIATVLSLILLSGCGSEERPESPITGPAWYITDVYTQPDSPSQLPDSIAGQAVMSLGEHTVAGDTGCAPFQAEVHYSHDGEGSTSADATHLRFDHLRIDDPTCEGAAQYFHEHIVSLLNSELDIEYKESSLLLRSSAEEIDAPALRLTSAL
ncbi:MULTISPECIES: META domain-containing protein [Corynebacterium]|uniref:META domain-containing protein n=1 Tax=Corynebacterium TaxID=1716 RepID=UPI00124BE3F0|nr:MULTISPECIES: META domain-containing protein [Corynebacterium]